MVVEEKALAPVELLRPFYFKLSSKNFPSPLFFFINKKEKREGIRE
jgi:hypothetical protein